MKNIAIILFLLFCFSCTDIDKLVKDIEEHNRMEIETTTLGFSNTRGEEFKRYQKLKSKASDKEIKNLIRHKNPIVRAYAFKILLDRNLIEATDAFEKTLNNNETFGKVDLSSSDICTEIYFHFLNYIAERKKVGNHTEEKSVTVQEKKLDSLVLYNLDEDHFLQYMALKDKTYDESYNKRIIELAIELHNPWAIFYVNENDIKIDTAKYKVSINKVLDGKFIGTNPKEELLEILENLN